MRKTLNRRLLSNKQISSSQTSLQVATVLAQPLTSPHNKDEENIIKEAFLNLHRSDRNIWKLNKIKNRIKGRILNYKKSNNLESDLDIYSYNSSKDSVRSEECSFEEVFPYSLRDSDYIESKSNHKSKPRKKMYLKKFLATKSKSSKQVQIEQEFKQDELSDKPLGNVVFEFMKMNNNSIERDSLLDILRLRDDKKRQSEKLHEFNFHSNTLVRNIDFGVRGLTGKRDFVNIRQDVMTNEKVNWSTFADKILVRNRGKVSISEVQLRITKILGEGSELLFADCPSHLNDIRKYEKSKFAVQQIFNVTDYNNKELVMKSLKKTDNDKISTLESGQPKKVLNPYTNSKPNFILQKQMMLSINPSKQSACSTTSNLSRHAKHSTEIVPMLSCYFSKAENEFHSQLTQSSSKVSIKDPKKGFALSTNYLKHDKSEKNIGNPEVFKTPKRNDSRVKSLILSRSPHKQNILARPPGSAKCKRQKSLSDLDYLRNSSIRRKNPYSRFIKDLKTNLTDNIDGFNYRLISSNNNTEGVSPYPASQLDNETIKSLNDLSFQKSLNLSEAEYANIHNLKFGVKSYEAEQKKYTECLSLSGTFIILFYE